MAIIPEYRISRYAASEPDETPAWLSLTLCLHGRTFTISVQGARFRDSPARLREFRAHLACIASDIAGRDDGDATVDDCFAWAAAPFLAAFAERAPKPAQVATATLADVLGLPSYECSLGAVDDRLDPGPITVVAGEEDDDHDFLPDNLPPLSDIFPGFPLSEVKVIVDDPAALFDSDPRRVRVLDAEYVFESVLGLGDYFALPMIHTFERIARAAFPPDVRTARLFGVVQDPGQPVAGILLHRIDGAVELDAVLTPETPPETRRHWVGQIRHTLAMLHERDIVWGNAWVGNVTIDGRGDAWIVDFMGGRVDGWVGEDVAGTIAGDLEGLEKIVHFINTGEDVTAGEDADVGDEM